MMFQDSAAALDPRMPVSALVAEPLAAQHAGTGARAGPPWPNCWTRSACRGDAATATRTSSPAGSASASRMARALALQPKVIVADEPVSALDVSVQAQILNLMRSLQDRFGLTYVVISHDLSLLKYLADRIGVMYLGKLVELGAGEQVYSAPRHPYTAGLIKSIPLPDPAHERAKTRPGWAASCLSAIDPPSGCRFRTRCPLATDQCAEETPVLSAVGGDARGGLPLPADQRDLTRLAEPGAYGAGWPHMCARHRAREREDAMTSHRLDPEPGTTADVFSREHEPVLTIDPGDTVTVRSLDASGHLDRQTTPGESGRGCSPSAAGTA